MQAAARSPRPGHAPSYVALTAWARLDTLTNMVSITVKLPEGLDYRLRHEARRRGITISELTSEAIASHLGPSRRLGAAAAGRSGRADISERIEKILARRVP